MGLQYGSWFSSSGVYGSTSSVFFVIPLSSNCRRAYLRCRYLKDKELKSGDRVAMRSSVEPDGQLVSLELTDLKLDDAGQVKVVAVNSEGDASTAARLTVIGAPFLEMAYALSIIVSFTWFGFFFYFF